MTKPPRYVTAPDGVRIAVYSEGSGPPLVMLHGGANDHTFAPELTGLLRRNHTVLKPDRRGRGASGDGDAYALPREVRDLIAVLRACPGAPTLFAYSFGALIAVEALAEADLPRLQRVVLFEPPIAGDRDPEYAAKARRMADLVAAGQRDEAVRFQLSAFHDCSPSDIEAMRSDADTWSNRVQWVGTNAREMVALHDGYRFDRTRLRDPRCPVKLLVGDATLPFLSESAERLSRVPFVRTHILKGVDHSGPRTHPDLVASHVLGPDADGR